MFEEIIILSSLLSNLIVFFSASVVRSDALSIELYNSLKLQVIPIKNSSGINQENFH